jgi:outer membrane protein assembly factor BamB
MRNRAAIVGRPTDMRCQRLLLGVAVLAVAGCSGSIGALAAHTGGPSPAATPSGGRQLCGGASDGYAWAEEVTLTGQARWRTSLATYPVDDRSVSSLEPLVDGPAAVFAQDGSVRELSLASGRQLWSYAVGQSVSGMWQWRGLVVVLTGVVSEYAQLTGLDAATGAVRWRLTVPGTGVVSMPVATTDGGLAMVRADGTLQVVSMATGAVRWMRPDASWLSLSTMGSEETTTVNGLSASADAQGLTAAGDVLIAVGNYGTIGYDDRTGRQRWEIASQLALPVGPQPLFADGDVVLASGNGGYVQFDALSAIAPASGRVAWQAVFNSPQDLLVLPVAGPAGVAVAAGRGLYLLDPRTGRQRWRESASADSPELVGASAVVTIEEDSGGGYRVLDRNAADGRVRWSVPGLSQSAMAAGLVFVQNPTVPALDAYRLSTGALAWQAPFPAGYLVRLAVVPGGVLVQALVNPCPAP